MFILEILQHDKFRGYYALYVIFTAMSVLLGFGHVYVKFPVNNCIS